MDHRKKSWNCDNVLVRVESWELNQTQLYVGVDFEMGGS